jgi:hypothetical protein
MPGVSKAFLHLVISYMAIATLFGVIYASLYLYIGPPSFKSDNPLQLFDFLYYSLFVPTSMGYPDIVPTHWLTKLVTLCELAFGILVIVIYVGTIVGNITVQIKNKTTNDRTTD